jgi:hypothetical protein
MRYVLLAMVLVMGLAWLLFVRGSGDGSAERRHGARAAPRAAVIGLLGDTVDGRTGRLRGSHVARLLRISLPGGAIEAERTLGPRLRRPDDTTAGASVLTDAAQVLAAAPDGRTVFALVRRPPGGRDSVAVIDAISLRTRRRYPLQRGIRYRGMAVGRSGRIYAYGGRRAGGSRIPVLTILDASGAPIASRAVPGRTRRDWWVYWGAPSTDERTFVLTYHGANTTGADWLDLSDGAMRRCEGRDSDRACVFEVHGAVEPFGSGFLATTGSEVIEAAANGSVTRRLRAKPRNVHLMHFALDADRSVLYMSSCGNRPAVQRVDLARDRAKTIRSGRICGAAVAAGAGFLVLAGAPAEHGYDAADLGLRLIDLAEPGPGVPVRRPGRLLDALVLAPAA